MKRGIKLLDSIKLSFSRNRRRTKISRKTARQRQRQWPETRKLEKMKIPQPKSRDRWKELLIHYRESDRPVLRSADHQISPHSISQFSQIKTIRLHHRVRYSERSERPSWKELIQIGKNVQFFNKINSLYNNWQSKWLFNQWELISLNEIDEFPPPNFGLRVREFLLSSSDIDNAGSNFDS